MALFVSGFLAPNLKDPDFEEQAIKEEEEIAITEVTTSDKAKQELLLFEEKLKILLNKYQVNELSGEKTSYTFKFYSQNKRHHSHSKICDTLECQFFGHKSYSKRFLLLSTQHVMHDDFEEIIVEDVEQIDDIVLISFGNAESSHDIYIENFSITNNANGNSWTVPFYDWISKHKYPFRVFNFAWAHNQSSFPIEPLNLGVKSVKVEMEFDPHQKKKFISYSFLLRTDHYQWVVSKRYSSFERFFSAMKSQHPDAAVERLFPPKKFLPGQSESHNVIKERRVALRTYIYEVSKQQDYCSSPEFLAIFNVPPTSILNGKKLGTELKQEDVDNDNDNNNNINDL